jgi:putative transposase
LTPADVYFGRDKQIKDERERIKKKTLQMRRTENLKWHKNEMAL